MLSPEYIALLMESEGPTQTFYKGMLLPNFEKFKNHRIPGFLSDLDMALIYADPRTMGNENIPRVIIYTDIDTNLIQDKRDVIGDMCGNWQSPKHPLHAELRKSIWWSTSGGHGNRGIYCGQPVDYKILFQSNSIEEFERIINSPEIQKLTDPFKHLTNDEEAHWSQYR